MKDYEGLAKEKNEEIKALTQKLVEIQRSHKSAFESEIQRLTQQLAEAEKTSREKDSEIEQLQMRCKEEARSVATVESARVGGDHSLRAAAAAGEFTCRSASGCAATPGKDVQRRMRKMLSKVYREIIGLSKAIMMLLKGDEPNMHLLMGEYTRESKELAMFSDLSGKFPQFQQDTELGVEDLEVLGRAISSIRSNLCDYYAEKYSNECGIQ